MPLRLSGLSWSIETKKTGEAVGNLHLDFGWTFSSNSRMRPSLSSADTVALIANVASISVPSAPKKDRRWHKDSPGNLLPRLLGYGSYSYADARQSAAIGSGFLTQRTPHSVVRPCMVRLPAQCHYASLALHSPTSRRSVMSTAGCGTAMATMGAVVAPLRGLGCCWSATGGCTPGYSQVTATRSKRTLHARILEANCYVGEGNRGLHPGYSQLTATRAKENPRRRGSPRSTSLLVPRSGRRLFTDDRYAVKTDAPRPDIRS
jgi:hypothetical protein